MNQAEKPSFKPSSSPEESGIRSTDTIDSRKRREESRRAYLDEVEQKIATQEEAGYTQVDTSAKPVRSNGEEEYLRRLAAKLGVDEEGVTRRIAAKAEEEHPDNPWEAFGPSAEKDTAKVWGTSEEEKGWSEQGAEEQKPEWKNEWNTEDTILAPRERRKRA